MGNLLTRRRELILASGGSSEWDVEWDYTMGLPENNGWTKDATGTSSATLTDSCVQIRAQNSNQHLDYSWSNQNSIGVFEAEYSFTNAYGNSTMFIGNGVDTVNGTRNQYSANYKGIYLYTATTIANMRKLQSAASNTYYKITIVLNGANSQVLVNDVIKADNIDLSTITMSSYPTRLRFSSSHSTTAATYNLKSMRLKLGRI